MALFRQLWKAPVLARQCSRVIASAPTNRGYADMPFSFASPNAIYYNSQNVKQVDVPGLNETFGILPTHVPLVTVLQPGVMSVIEESGTTKKFFVSSGSVTINKDSTVQILAEEAYPLENLDSQAIKAGLAEAQKNAQAASTERGKVEAQIAVSCYEAMSRAVDSGP
ncbi:ATP synthase subunit delta, mitochondrial-like [Mizuhopecten yessoensis]|uniref:F-ATPase delta subunit n=1 Tax=Mizuhopecten yessoensis TaxID=6573 RepID=A0A210PEK0_MIZYE|nr:ATP synthase subunit delta, mitochondrial-like [Mizuhopecten yessoensis]OWF34897.1 ATP synthase subunit delta, mitochondrial [Mizuhopecten yessoensis]